MNRRGLAGAAGLILVIGVLLALAVRLQAMRESAYPPPSDTDDAVYVTSGSVVRRVAGAYDALAADTYWIRALQYYGGTKRRLEAEPAAPEPPALIAAVDHDDYRQLYPLLDITTTLDPRFNLAYRFGAVFLAEPYPAGPGRPDLAIKLLEKGLSERPDKWEYMLDIGFVHYWYRHDYREAASWFARAGEIEGAPWWLKSLAATTVAQGGDRRSSRLMWQAIRDSAEVEWLRTDADRRLAQLRALDEIDSLQEAVDRLTARSAAPPDSWAPIVTANGWPGVPLDPSGVPYEIGEGGRVRLSTQSTLYPLPADDKGGNPAPRPSS
jgi:hypothetical protein